MRRRKRRKSSSRSNRRCAPPPRPPGRRGRPSPGGAPPPPPPVATCSSPSGSKKSPEGSPDTMVRTRNAPMGPLMLGRLAVQFYLSDTTGEIQLLNLPIRRDPLSAMFMFPPWFSPLRSCHIWEMTQEYKALLLLLLQHYSSFPRFGQIRRKNRVYIFHDFFPPADIRNRFGGIFQTAFSPLARQMAV